MSDERRNRFDDLKDAYALGALTEDERREFEDYLGEHPELQAEADDLGAIVNLLALAPQEHEPPSELRRNLLASIGDGSREEHTPRRARVGRFLGPSGIVVAAVAAVAVLAIIGLFGWAVSLRTENEDLRGEVQTRRAYELQGSGPAQDVRGQLIRIGEGQAVLFTENLPPPRQGETYQAWLMRNGVAEPAGLFEPREEEPSATPIEGAFQGADAVSVTAEPSGGSPQPTSDILLTAAL